MFKKKRFNPSSKQSEEFKRLVRNSLNAGISDTNRIQIQLELIKHVKVSKQSIRRWKRQIAIEPVNRQVSTLEKIRDKEIVETMKAYSTEAIDKVIAEKPKLFKRKPLETFKKGNIEYIKTAPCNCGNKYDIPAFQHNCSKHCTECGMDYDRKKKVWYSQNHMFGYSIGALKGFRHGNY